MIPSNGGVIWRCDDASVLSRVKREQPRAWTEAATTPKRSACARKSSSLKSVSRLERSDDGKQPFTRDDELRAPSTG